MRIRHKQTSCVCVVCGIRFIALSSRAKTCTEVCRKRLSRQRQKERLPRHREHPVADPAAAAPPAREPRLSRPAFRSSAPRLSPIERFLRLAAPMA